MTPRETYQNPQLPESREPNWLAYLLFWLFAGTLGLILALLRLLFTKKSK